MFHVPERYRVRVGDYGTDSSAGNNGQFLVKSNTPIKYLVVASDGGGWEHVSVSIPNAERCPRWDEMCFIKSIFWDDEDCVMQLHPPKSDYISVHPYCLHLWRPTNATIPTPHYSCVGPKPGETLNEMLNKHEADKAAWLASKGLKG